MTALTYAIITLGNTVLTSVMSGWLIYFYLPPGGNALVPVGLFGIVVLISRISHIAANLLVTRFGSGTTRRWLRYLIGGAWFMPTLFVLLWLPLQAQASTVNLIYLFVILIAFNVASGLHQAAYRAILPALDAKEQGAIGTWNMAFLLLGGILAALSGPLIQSLNYPQAIGMFALGSAPFLIVPGLVLSRRLVGKDQPLERAPFFESVRAAWGIPAFRGFALSWGLMWLATTFTFETIPYIVTEICHLSKAEAVYFYLAPLVVSIIAYPLISKLSARYGVKTIYRASLLAGAVAMPGLILISERIPIPLPAQGLIWLSVQTFCLMGAQTSPGAITAEITSGNEAQQNALYAFGNLIDQLASGLALAIIPFSLILGNSMANPIGIKLLGPLGAFFLLVSFVSFGCYKFIRFCLVN